MTPQTLTLFFVNKLPFEKRKMLVRTNGNSKPISKEEENTLKSRLNLFQNALLMQKCSSSTKEEALRSLIGRGSFLSQMIDVVKGGEELPVANDEVKDFFYLMGDCLQNLKVIEYCQRPDPDGTQLPL